MLCPGLFPGVTPWRRDGESLFVALACTFRLPGRSGYCERNPRTAAAHVPYADGLKIITNCE